MEQSKQGRRFFAGRLALLFCAVAFAFFAANAFAQTDRGLPNKDDRQENVGRRKEIRDLREEGKDARVERVQLRGKNILERTTIRADRMDQTIGRVENVAKRMQEKGKDVASVLQYTASAKEKVVSARAMTSEAQGILDSLDSADLKGGVGQFKAKVKDVYTTLVSARRDVVESVKILRGASAAPADQTQPSEAVTQ
jgi:hypothetical protein